MSIRLMSSVWDSDYAKTSHAKLLVMLKLADHANDDGECYPSQDTIAKKCGLARPTVNGIIKDLEQDSRLTITHTQASNRYNLFFEHLDSSVSVDDSPVSPEMTVEKIPVSPEVTPGVSVDDSGCQRRLHKSSDNHQESSSMSKDTEVAELVVELDDEFSGKKKIRSKKSSSLKISDARAKHPIVLMVKGLMRRYPDKLLWDKLINRFGENFDRDKLQACRESWIERGYNPNAMTWCNWYFDGIPERQIQNGANQQNNGKRTPGEIIANREYR